MNVKGHAANSVRVFTTEDPPIVGHRFLWIWLAVVAAFALIGFPVFSLWLINWFDSTDLRWVYELEQRKRHSAAKLTGKKVILAGGSSTLFGLDAATMERELGRPVLNLGTHGAMGLRYLLQDARELARPGDTVILQLEMAQYFSGERMMEMEERYAWTYRPNYFLRLPVRTALASIYGQPKENYVSSWKTWNQRLRGDLSNGDPPKWPGYSYVQLNSRGDFRPDTFPQKAVTAPPPKPKERVHKTSAAALADFVQDCRKGKVEVFVAPPIHPRPSAELGKRYENRFRSIEEFLSAQQVPVLADVRAGLYPPELMADTPNHLSGTGRQLHTSKVVAALREHSAHTEPKALPFFLATPHETWFPEEIPSSRVRCLTSQPLNAPGCLTPADVDRLRQSGQEVCFASEEVAQLLGSASTSAETVRSVNASLASLLQAYPDHLFAIATLGEIETAAYAVDAGLPWLEELLRKPGHKAAIFGTGKYSAIRLGAAGEDDAFIRLSRYDPKFRNATFPMDVNAQGGAPSGHDAGVTVAAHQFLRGTRPGLQVVVIDPDAGIVTFTAMLREPVQTLVHLRRLR